MFRLKLRFRREEVVVKRFYNMYIRLETDKEFHIIIIIFFRGISFLCDTL